MRPRDFYLTGDFNDWEPRSPAFKFAAVTSPYGRDACDQDHPDLCVIGGYTLDTNLPKGPLRFRIVEHGSPIHQWSVAEKKADDGPYSIQDCHYRTRHGITPYAIVDRGDADVPHAEFNNEAGRLRWDFHPHSQTLSIHHQFERSPGMKIKPWRTFRCDDLAFDTWVSLPFGYHPDADEAYPVWYVFDGRALMYGENPWRHQHNEPGRQFPHLLDIMARHGAVAPAIVVGLGVPGDPPQRRKTYWRQTSWLHKAYVNSLCHHVQSDVIREFPASPDTSRHFLMGLSNGGDMALAVVAAAPDHFGGALALSPEGADQIVPRLGQLTPDQRGRLKIAIAYVENEPFPMYQSTAIEAARKLRSMDVQHLLHFVPQISHTDCTMCNHIAGCVHFQMDSHP